MASETDVEAFKAELRKDGYEAVDRRMEAHEGLDEHMHPFHVRALFTAGEITVDVDDEPRVYKPGDIFVVAAQTVHTEWAGADGVTFISGRKED